MALLLLPFGATAAAPESLAAQARRNGEQARKALVDSNRIMHAWLRHRDPDTGLLPRNVQDTPPLFKHAVNLTWTVKDSAADLYPFMVLAARFTEPTLYGGAMLDLLRQEVLLSTRIGRLADDVQPGRGGFVRTKPDMGAIIFGSSEYMKDGLLPLTEMLGDTPWYHRMEGIAADVIRHAPFKTSHGALPAQSCEVNGNMLQVLSRLYWKTGDENYLNTVIAIADFYLLDMLPKTQFVPVDRWDFAGQKPVALRFRLSDHGNEIVGGLSEAFVLASHQRPDKAAQYRPAFVSMMDQLLKLGRNADGVWHDEIDIGTGASLTKRHAHCWGYMFNGVYTAYMATGETRFRAAVEHAIQSVAERPRYLFDESPPIASWKANAYSDSIESALVLLNRIPHAGLAREIDPAVEKMRAIIRPSGIVEGWYGDGNTIRTLLMYALWKSQGTQLEPWSRTVALGAVREGDEVTLSVSAPEGWSGMLRFDYPRHRVHWHLPVNYPRLNEWPEWFAVEDDRRYWVQIGNGVREPRIGAELRRGLAVNVARGETLLIKITEGGAPPYGR
ncbi:MAG: hypothetical protein Q7S40_09295 [Opitutaceae bacterium]|nr:hypothetical protein [Opitutaceae bacterium]